MWVIAGPLARVLLRYIGMFMVARGVTIIDFSDPDLATLVEFGIGALISAGAELWWFLARKYGWSQ